MRVSFTQLIFFFLSAASSRAFAASEIQFRADFYSRDLSKDTLLERGNAWVKRDDREIWADEIQVDFKKKVAVAKGHVHVRDGGVDIWSSEANYDLEGEQGTMNDAVLVRGQMVIAGVVVRKVSSETFEVEEGTYSNCNTSLMKDSGVAGCKLDWKLYGRRFSITTESYAQFFDSLVFVRDMPILYTPYFIIPVKTKRQSGFLLPSFSGSAGLGGGSHFPFFINLGPWHDLTVTPGYYSKTGVHSALDYRYQYSLSAGGRFQFFFTQQRFSSDLNNPAVNDSAKPRLLGVLGEWAVSAENHFAFGKRGFSRQKILAVSNPYYTQDYYADLGTSANASYLRSQIDATYPWDHWLATAFIRQHQSLIISKDSGADGGAVTELPSVNVSRANTGLLGKILSWETDLSATEFFRAPQFDQIPLSPANFGTNFDANRSFDSNDFLRSGRRVLIEPRLVANVPMPPGFQFQPVLTAGSLLYHFDLPSASFVHREYLQAELPLSLYLSRQFETSFSGYEKISHVFQPRITYARTLYDSISDPTHPFFDKAIANPRFDIRDQFSEFEYMRFELINRFRRKTGDSRERFFLLQLSEQYNLRKVPGDPRYGKRLGPVEIFSELAVWRFAMQLQATYDLELTTGLLGPGIRENSWSASLQYAANAMDYIRFNTLLRNKYDPSLSAQSLYLDFYQTLPLFFDLAGTAEYSMRGAGLLGYSLAFHFGMKERACWGISLRTGRDSLKRPFVNLDFRLNFGNPGSL